VPARLHVVGIVLRAPRGRTGRDLLAAERQLPEWLDPQRLILSAQRQWALIRSRFWASIRFGNAWCWHGQKGLARSTGAKSAGPSTPITNKTRKSGLRKLPNLRSVADPRAKRGVVTVEISSIYLLRC
jgi:hypothetical protein